MPRKNHTYSMRVKRDVLDAFRQHSQRAVARRYNIPRCTLRYWVGEEDNIGDFAGHERSKSRKRDGVQSIPFAEHLLMYMKDQRREEKLLCTRSMIIFIKANYPQWLRAYVAASKSADCAYESLFRLMWSFAKHHGFAQRAVHFVLEKTKALEAIRDAFSAAFWSECETSQLSDIINIDETDMHFDMLPSKVLVERGGSSKVANLQPHSARMTAVLGIRADGGKLPILFILKGAENGSIRRDELPTYPKDHYYTTQVNAWMDSRVWREYLRTVVKPEITGPSVLLLENLKCHVPTESREIAAGELFSHLRALPPKSTSVCQPLDVGVMGPLKKKLRAAWLVEEHVSNASAAQKRRIMVDVTGQPFTRLGGSVRRGGEFNSVNDGAPGGRTWSEKCSAVL